MQRIKPISCYDLARHVYIISHMITMGAGTHCYHTGSMIYTVSNVHTNSTVHTASRVHTGSTILPVL